MPDRDLYIVRLSGGIVRRDDEGSYQGRGGKRERGGLRLQ